MYFPGSIGPMTMIGKAVNAFPIYFLPRSAYAGLFAIVAKVGITFFGPTGWTWPSLSGLQKMPLSDSWKPLPISTRQIF